MHLKEEVLRVARIGRRRNVGCPTFSTSSASVSAGIGISPTRSPSSAHTRVQAALARCLNSCCHRHAIHSHVVSLETELMRQDAAGCWHAGFYGQRHKADTLAPAPPSPDTSPSSMLGPSLAFTSPL